MQVTKEHQDIAKIVYAGLPWTEDGKDLDPIECWDYIAKTLAQRDQVMIEKAMDVANCFQDMAGWQKGESRNKLIVDITEAIKRLVKTNDKY